MADSGQTQTFLSTMAASRAQRRFALAIVLLLGAAFVVTVPFAAVPLLHSDAFIPAYETALFVEDAITAALLFAQFAILRLPSLLLLGIGYLFTGLIVVPHMLVFPGLFTPAGLLGAGPSSAAWLYVAWHVGFPLAVIVYAFMNDERPSALTPGQTRRAILVSIAATLALVLAFTWLSTAGASLLPQVIASDRRTASFPYVSGSVWLLAVIALALLWWRRRRTVIELWLGVVLFAWVGEIALSVVLAPARFSIGFYLGRLYGVIAASVVLIALLSQTTALYARLARAIATERRVRERRLSEMEAMLSHLSRVSDLGHVVTALIHEVNQPLAAIGNYLSALQRLAVMGDQEKVVTTIEKTLGQSERAREIIRRLREFVARREIDRRPEPLATTVEDAIAVAQAAHRPHRRRDRNRARAAGGDGGDPPTSRSSKCWSISSVTPARRWSRARVRTADQTIASRPLGPEKLEISIADTGPGLPPMLREKLFQPFVTTKATGMGVGLSICRFIIEAHGEKLQVADNTGGGTVFSFTLPLALAPAKAAGGSERMMHGQKLILAAIVLAASFTSARAEDAPRFFRIGTAAITGTYFQIGAEIANAISKPPGTRDCDRGGSCGVPGLVAVAQATEGSVANVLAVGQGQIEAAFSQADVATWAYRGDAPVITPARPAAPRPPRRRTASRCSPRPGRSAICASSPRSIPRPCISSRASAAAFARSPISRARSPRSARPAPARWPKPGSSCTRPRCRNARSRRNICASPTRPR